MRAHLDAFPHPAGIEQVQRIERRLDAPCQRRPHRKLWCKWRNGIVSAHPYCAAIEALAQGVSVGVVSKSLLGKAHTVMAEGGIAAAMGNVAAIAS